MYGIHGLRSVTPARESYRQNSGGEGAVQEERKRRARRTITARIHAQNSWGLPRLAGFEVEEHPPDSVEFTALDDLKGCRAIEGGVG